MYTYIRTYVCASSHAIFMQKSYFEESYQLYTLLYVGVHVQQLPAEPSSLYNTKYNAVPAHCIYTTYIYTYNIYLTYKFYVAMQNYNAILRVVRCWVRAVANLWVERDQSELCVASQLCAFQNWKIELQFPLP